MFGGSIGMFAYFIGGVGATAIALIALGLAICRGTEEVPQASQLKDQQGLADLEKRLEVNLLPHEVTAFMGFERRTGRCLLALNLTSTPMEWYEETEFQYSLN